MRIDDASIRSLEALAASPGSLAPERAAREFEAMLLAQVWKGAQKPLGIARGLGGGSAGQMYRELFVEEVTRRIALSGAGALSDPVAARLRGATDPSAERAGDG